MPTGGGQSTKRRSTRTLTGLYEKKFFNREPKLRQWAINVGQYKRHVVYANDRRVLRTWCLPRPLPTRSHS